MKSFAATFQAFRGKFGRGAEYRRRKGRGEKKKKESRASPPESAIM